MTWVLLILVTSGGPAAHTVTTISGYATEQDAIQRIREAAGAPKPPSYCLSVAETELPLGTPCAAMAIASSSDTMILLARVDGLGRAGHQGTSWQAGTSKEVI